MKKTTSYTTGEKIFLTIMLSVLITAIIALILTIKHSWNNVDAMSAFCKSKGYDKFQYHTNGDFSYCYNLSNGTINKYYVETSSCTGEIKQ